MPNAPASDDRSVPPAGAMAARRRRILRFSAWHIIQMWWFELVLPRFGLSRLAERGREKRLLAMARGFHVLAVDLGGLMIKVGQFLSARLDVLPPEVTSTLAGLQDKVPPVPFVKIRALAEAELGMPLERAYESFAESPLASASLGQAHRARLSPAAAADAGFAEVVVKVQRPGIDTIVDVDLLALSKVAGWLSRTRVVSDRVDAPALVVEFAHTCREEIDYLNEATYSERFAADFQDDVRVATPAIAWERTTRRVLTLSDVSAIKINDVDGLRAAGITPAEVADVFAAVMFDQLFLNGFFHADPHPGNIFVTPTPSPPAQTSLAEHPHAEPADERSWHLTFVDFGMMGTVPDSMRAGLRRLLIAAASRDGKGLVDGIREIGVLLPSADTAQLEHAMTALFARFGGMGFAELREVDPREFRAFAEEFGDLVRSLPFQLPDNFLLVIRAMSMTSGLCSALEPEFNIWDAIQPYAARLLREESAGAARDFAKRAARSARMVAALPGRVDELIQRAHEGTITVANPGVERRVSRLQRCMNRVRSAVLFAGLLIGGAVLRMDDPGFGNVVLALSLLPLAHAILPGGARGR